MNARHCDPLVRDEINIQATRQYLTTNPAVQAAYIFGSVARGKTNKLSDVDIAVLLPANLTEQEQVAIQLQLMCDFEKFTKREVQIIVLNHSSLILSFHIIHDGLLFYEGARDQRIDFEVRTRKIYFDFKPRLDRINQVVMDCIREEGLGNRKRRTTRTLEAAERIHQGLAKSPEC